MDGSGEAARRMVVGSSCGKAMIHPIMMRFRPIAPKPVAGGCISGGTSSVESKNSSISQARTKRKYVRVRRYNRKKKTTSTRSNTSAGAGESTVATTTTLQLLPERDAEIVGGGSNNEKESEVVLVSDPKRGAVELWVTVEWVREECMDLDVVELGCTDEERIKNLEEDTCPGFVSDGMNRVEWLNEAFKRMVRQRQKSSISSSSNNNNNNDSESPAGEIGVRLIISKPKMPYLGRGRGRGRVFTCQIKLQFKRGTEMEKDSKLVPCDAWRMDGGGFAWKLDVKTALTLAPLLQEDFQ